jgi:hypothetical protein
MDSVLKEHVKGPLGIISSYRSEPDKLLIGIKPREGSIGHRACMLDRQNEPLGPNAEDDVATLGRKVDYLSRSDSYISAPETVTVRETYILVWFRCQ